MSSTQLTYKSHIFDENTQRVKNQTTLFDYYTGNDERTLESLSTIQAISFVSDKAEFNLQQAYFSLTEKIVNQLAIVYKQPATRKIIDGESVNDDLTDAYNSLLPSDINTIDKMAHRYAKLFNTSLTAIRFNNETGKLEYDVRSSHEFSVLVDADDSYKMTALSYPRYFENAKGDQELFHVVWTPERHYKVPHLNIEMVTSKKVLEVPGDAQPIGNNTEMINPYGVIPYAVCRLKKQGDFWGNGLTDVVTCNGQINFLLSDLINTAVMQAWGQMVLINAGLENTKSKVKVGIKYPLNIVNPDSTGHSDAKFIHANPMLKEVMEIVDWMIKMVALSKGLNPNSFLATVQATSGYSKIIDAMEQLEVRQDDLEPCRIYEDDRYKITKLVLAHHKTLGQTEVDIPDLDRTYLETKFGDIEIPKTQDEQQKEDEFNLKNNFVTYIDVMKRLYPDMEEGELEKKLANNTEINERLKPVVAMPVIPFPENGTTVTEGVNGA